MLGWQLTKADGTVIPLHARAVTSISWALRGHEHCRRVGAASHGLCELGRAARAWPFTDKGRAAVAATREARDASLAACVPYGPPALMAIPALAVVEVGTSEVTFVLDGMNARRVVHLDRQSQPCSARADLLGHSIGRWEGDTLVVETAGFSAQPNGYAFDLPSSAAKRIVERFALSADRKHLEYEATVEDAEYLAAPVTHRSQWDYRPGLKPANLPCDPEAASRFTTDE